MIEEFTLYPVSNPIPNSIKNYYVKIAVEIPYPKEFEYREQANFCGTAINRAMKKMRKELNGKHLKEVRIIARRIQFPCEQKINGGQKGGV